MVFVLRCVVYYWVQSIFGSFCLIVAQSVNQWFSEYCSIKCWIIQAH